MWTICNSIVYHNVSLLNPFRSDRCSPKFIIIINVFIMEIHYEMAIRFAYLFVKRIKWPFVYHFEPFCYLSHSFFYSFFFGFYVQFNWLQFIRYAFISKWFNAVDRILYIFDWTFLVAICETGCLCSTFVLLLNGKTKELTQWNSSLYTNDAITPIALYHLQSQRADNESWSTVKCSIVSDRV